MPDDLTRSKQTWAEASTRVQDALNFLLTTAEDVTTSRTIDRDVRAEAIAIAKRLEAQLTGFGFAEAAQHARNVVATLDHAGLPQPERLQQQVEALHAALTSALKE